MMWWTGAPGAALADIDEALKDAREIDHAPSLMYALTITSMTHLFLGNGDDGCIGAISPASARPTHSSSK
jgi:hypothetical protein